MNVDTALMRALRYNDLVAIGRALERQSLADLGLDINGRWVGFEAAAAALAAEAA